MIPLKYLPHFGLLAITIFLITDTPLINPISSNLKIKIKQSEGSQTEGSHKEGSNNKNISQEEQEKRMGIFHYNAGNKNFKEGRFDEAIINYKKALHHNKSFKEAIINLSTAYMKNSNYDEALKILKRGMLLDSQNPHIHYNYACYFSLIGQPKKSLEMLKIATRFGYNKFDQIALDPDLKKLRESSEFKNWFQKHKT